jgi:hypothetical protein
MMDSCVSGEKAWYEAWTIRAGFAGLITFGLAGVIGWGAAGGGGIVFGFLLGMCLSRSFGRLQTHKYQPEACVTGVVDRQWKNDGLFVPPLALFGNLGLGIMDFFERDGDWLFNLIILDNQSYLLTEAYDGGKAYVRHKSDCTPYLHCEISSNQGPFGCYGSTIGALIGAGLSLVFLAPMAASCAAWGPFFWLCLIIVAVLAILITYASSVVGGIIGALLGKLADEIEGQGGKGESVKDGACVTFCGEWITDMDHGWNELHELKTIQIHKDIPPFSTGQCIRISAAKAFGSRIEQNV